MKLIHISDLHFGLKLRNRDLSEDQRHVLNQVLDYAKSYQPQAVLIAGDVYDKADPSLDAIDMFNRFTSALHSAAPNAEIMIVSGNHDSAGRLDLYRDILRANRVHAIGMPPTKNDEYIERVTLEDEHGPVDFYLLPFVKPSMIKQIVGQAENGNNLSYNDAVHKLVERENVDQTRRNVLVSHQYYTAVDGAEIERSESEIRQIGNVDEVKGDVLTAFDYAALGHIHKPQCVGSERYRYCGTPMQYSVSEAGQEKGAILVELGAKGDVKTTVLPLTPLRQVKKIEGDLEDVLKQACDDYVAVVLTDKVDLNVIDMQDRLRRAFPNLLITTRVTFYNVNYDALDESAEELLSDPYELCKSFLNEPLDEETNKLLEEIINLAKEEN